MNNKKVIFLLFLFIPIIITITAEKLPSQQESLEKQKQMNNHYQLALQHFTNGNYTKAIQEWEEVLKIDPGQVEPTKLIAVAREKNSTKNSSMFNEIESAYIKGNYSSALSKTNELISSDPTNTDFKRLADKLQTVNNLFGNITNKDATSQLLRISIYNYIKDTKPKTIANAIIFASQLSPNDKNIKKFMELLQSQYYDTFASIKLLPEMNLVEQKLNTALNCVYDKKFDGAVFECNEVLELEPENVMALKRLGSAYYGLKKPEKAKEIWRRARKIAPDDEELKRFLSVE